jgi:hypothetical protein
MLKSTSRLRDSVAVTGNGYVNFPVQQNRKPVLIGHRSQLHGIRTAQQFFGEASGDIDFQPLQFACGVCKSQGADIIFDGDNQPPALLDRLDLCGGCRCRCD